MNILEQLIDKILPFIISILEIMGIFVVGWSGLSAFWEYLKLTFSNSTEPFKTVVTGFSGFLMVLCSSNTSTILLADSSDIVIITKNIESIIRLIRI